MFAKRLHVIWSGANMRKSCGSQKMLQSDCLHAKIDFTEPRASPPKLHSYIFSSPGFWCMNMMYDDIFWSSLATLRPVAHCQVAAHTCISKAKKKQENSPSRPAYLLAPPPERAMLCQAAKRTRNSRQMPGARARAQSWAASRASTIHIYTILPNGLSARTVIWPENPRMPRSTDLWEGSQIPLIVQNKKYHMCLQVLTLIHFFKLTR